MSNSVYGIALSGLNVARAGLTTTSNNIANANTVGYNRQETIVAAREANFVGGAYIGQGVDIQTVRRVYSDFMVSQQQNAASDAAFFQAKYDQVQRLDGIIADDASGLSSALSNFFASAQTLSSA
ncbi:MAG: flagellar basal body protein, partial [Limnobacter sp.]|nr:flagellar basal body protein [Limnobacter sp.]